MTANEINALVDRLREQRNLSDAEFKTILETDAYDAALQKAADEVRRTHYGTDVYVRGLIEFTNYCKNNCYYCGIRRDNRNVTRYRLTKEEILSCCAEGYDLGFRTFVLQGGEDPFTRMISSARSSRPSMRSTRTAPLRFPSAKRAAKATGSILMRAQTAIFCVMRRPIPSITASCTRMN